MFTLLSFGLALISLASAELAQDSNSKRGYNVVGAVVAAIVLGAIIFIGVCVMVCCRKKICRCLRLSKKGQAVCDAESIDANSLKVRSETSLKKSESDEKQQAMTDPEKQQVDHVNHPSQQGV